MIRVPAQLYIANNYFIKQAQAVVYGNDGRVIAVDKHGNKVAESNKLEDVLNHVFAKVFTPGRTWKEKLIIVGDFAIYKAIEVPSYTGIEIVGRIKLADGVDDDVIRNDDPTNGNTDIEIIGGIIDGNYPNAQSTDHQGILLNNAERAIIRGVTIRNVRQRAVDVRASKHVIIEENIIHKSRAGISASSVHGVIIKNNHIYNAIYIEPAGHGIYVSRADGYVVVEGNIVEAENLWSGIALGETNAPPYKTIVANNIVRSPIYEGIHFWESPGEKAVIANNYVENTGRHGILISRVKDAVVKGNIIVGASSNGINVEKDVENVIIEGNLVTGCGNGILVTYIDTYKPRLVSIIGNLVYGNRYWGIRVVGDSGYEVEDVKIIANMVFNNSQDTPNTYDGIILRYVKRAIILGNYSIDNQETATQRYGIRLDYSVADAIVEENYLYGNAGGAIYIGSGFYGGIKRNYGYATENSGVATLPAGATSVTVNHGLASAPSKVLITPLGQPAGKLWVENITDTSFDIVTDTAPSSDLKVAWYAEV